MSNPYRQPITADEIANIIRPLAHDTADLRACAKVFTQSADEQNCFGLNALLFTLTLPSCWAVFNGTTTPRQIDYAVAFEAGRILLAEIPTASVTLTVGPWVVDPYDTLYLVDFFRKRLQRAFDEDRLSDVAMPFFELCEQLLLIRTRKMTEIMTESIQQHVADPRALGDDIAYGFSLMLLSQTSSRYTDLTFDPDIAEATQRDLLILTPVVDRRYIEVYHAMDQLSGT
jgi:hypothetical protein